MYLLDTNTVIYFFKGQGRVPERLLAIAPGETTVSSITVYEIETGIAKSRQPERLRSNLDQFLSMVVVLPFQTHEAKRAARIRADLEESGMPIGPYDILIAATAVANARILVTRNVREFSRVQGLMVENWY
ncbi:PilT protein domain protein [Desulfonatronospira thiodismutans ASO3-1]|uniref:Ribonuclease VapC n=1 Tax=Desulfonatronospira thiodismutans ASO3-1 TaxID=555779 RepID=D6SR65_9BACT|nr:type II toxin-antitoxin system VapC family toxin [Desulfonatronospira thiodismutans]EFI33181.1 PilT protein domain protein [Desulfonatronospira thiodismutans ASO3-1]